LNIVSTNISKPTTIIWKNNAITTGIYKNPVSHPIFLDEQGVKGDEVSDRKVHGGHYKACYLFSADYYPYWKSLYPNLTWDYGMFGENLTISGLDESKILVGDIYKIGKVLAQVTQPREPCFKFGIKFGNQDVLKQFIDHVHPGLYVRILESGFVKVNDKVTLIEQAKNSLSVQDFYKLVFAKNKNQGHLKLAVDLEALPLPKREKLRTYILS
jgi:MOSC domain-containing protein YiiM